MASFDKNLAGVMTKFTIHELSGVDLPAQKGARAVFLKRDASMAYDPIIKREFSDEERKELAGNGKALSDGSFPIVTEEDLHNAVRAIGRAKDESKAKAHIISRAKSMGLSSALPDGWVKKELDMSAIELRKALGLPENATEAQLVAAVLTKAKDAEDEAEKAKKDKEKAEKALRKASMTEAEKEHCKGMSDGDCDDFMSKSKDDRDKLMAKRLSGDETITVAGQTVRKSAVGDASFLILKALGEQVTEVKAENSLLRKASEDATYQKRAQDELSHLTGTVQERAAMLKAADLVADTEARKGLLAQLTAANAMAKAGFQRMGTNGGMSDISGNGGAEAKLTKMAQDYEKSHPGTSFVKAYDQITQTDQGRELYKEYLAERREAAK